jgi:serine/threonine protein kinase
VATGLRFIKQICRALSLVHGQGAIHRDLKADNILVDRRGVVRVVDFGLAAFADEQSGVVHGAMGTFTYMAPETVRGRSTAASDVYSIGLLMYELFTGGGPHLNAEWTTEGDERGDENFALKAAFRFAPPSASQNEIRNDYRWLDALIPRCLTLDPERRIPDAGALLDAIERCEQGKELPMPPDTVDSSAALLPPQANSAEQEQLFREVRKLMASKAFDQVIDRLDVHRPAEWATVDAAGARTLRALGQAYLGRGDLPAARDCLEQLRSAQKQQALLSKTDYAAALTDLFKCYRALGQAEQAKVCQEEAKRLM